MSKGNMLLGHARGKVGDLVFSRTNGQQVVRSRAAVVKNPRTETQMIQRIILNTVAQAYSKMQPIVDHSFEGVQAGQKTMSRFFTVNIARLRDAVAAAVADPTVGLGEVRAFTPVGSNMYSPNAFVLSAGSLPQLTPSVASTTTCTMVLGGTTYGEIIEALGLKRGDQLTFMSITGAARNQYFEYARVILDPTNEDGTEANLSVPLLVDGKINLPSPRNTGEFGLLSISEEGVLTYRVGTPNRAIYSTAVIVSRKNTDGSWLRSNSQMVLGENAISDFYSMLECLSMLEDGSIDALSDRYLNNAGRGRLASAARISPIVVQLKRKGDSGQPSTDAGSATIINYAFENYLEDGSKKVLELIDDNGKRYAVRIDSEQFVSYGRIVGAETNGVLDTNSDVGDIATTEWPVYVSWDELTGPLTTWLCNYAGYTWQAIVDRLING